MNDLKNLQGKMNKEKYILVGLKEYLNLFKNKDEKIMNNPENRDAMKHTYHGGVLLVKSIYEVIKDGEKAYEKNMESKDK